MNSHHEPVISVIIPVYNGESTIEETVQSVLAQTFTRFELIIINDGSTDLTVALLQQFQDKRLRVHHFENKGLSESRNRGIALARGEYLSFVDADDLWSPEKLQAQWETLHTNPEAGVAYSWTRFFDSHGSYPPPKLDYQGNVLEPLMLENFIASGSNILIRRSVVEAIGGFNTLLSVCADWDFYLRAAVKCPFTVVPFPHVQYRLGATSMSATGMKTLEEDALSIFSWAIPLSKLPKNRVLAQLYVSMSAITLSRAQTIQEAANSLRSMLKAIRCEPWILYRSPFAKRCLLKAMCMLTLSPQVTRRMLGALR